MARCDRPPRTGLRHLSAGLIFWGMATFIGSATPETALAQTEAAFSRIDLRLDRAQNLANSNSFFRYWRPGYGFEGSLATPFYFGQAEAGLAWHQYNVDDPGVPRMRALYVFAGWGVPLKTGPLRWHAGFRIGNYGMNFDDEHALHASENDESEFSLSGLARVEVDFTSHLALSAGVSRTTVFTHHRLYFDYFQAGLIVRIPTGAAFQNALR